MDYKEKREQWRAGCRREAAQLMRRAVTHGQIRARIVAVANKLKWPLGRTENIWRMEARIIEAWELIQIRRLRP